MPYQSHPTSLWDLLDKLSYRVNRDDGNRQTDGCPDGQTQGDDNNPSVEGGEG